MKSILFAVCILMSLLTYCMMAYDKSCAKRRARRIPEKLLFLLAACLGAPGGTLAMVLYRHKTRHAAFRVIFPALTCLQLLLLVFLHIQQ